MDNNKDRPQPGSWKLEGRLAKNEANMREAKDISNQTGMGAVGDVIIAVLSVFGVIAALIPTVLYFGVMFIPLFLLYSCLSEF